MTHDEEMVEIIANRLSQNPKAEKLGYRQFAGILLRMIKSHLLSFVEVCKRCKGTGFLQDANWDDTLCPDCTNGVRLKEEK